MEVLAEYLVHSVALVLRRWSLLILVWVLLVLRLTIQVRVIVRREALSVKFMDVESFDPKVWPSCPGVVVKLVPPSFV
jgi:hypothetical protein